LGRLTGRGTENEEALRRRLTTALQELEAAAAFDFFVVNEEMERSVREVRELARTGEAPPGGTSGTLNDARQLLVGIESLLRRGTLLSGH
jgi:guanylate kinase